MEKIKILYIIDTVSNITAGSERQLSQLIANLERDKFEPHLMVLRSSNYLDQKYFPCPLHSLDMKSVLSFSGWRNYRRLVKFIAGGGFHIVQTFFPDSNVIGVLAAHKAGCRIIISSRRNTGFSYTSKVLVATRFANRHVTRFLANSALVVNYISKMENIDPERFSVIYNGLDPNRFKVDEEQIRHARAQIGGDDSDCIVGIVANLRPVKDIPTFIKAAVKVLEKAPNCRFVIVGGGDERFTSELKALASGLIFDDSIRFLGDVANPMPLIKNFDVGVLCSISEGLSNTLMEYGALRIPAVATDVGGNSEVIIEGKTGLLVPSENPDELAKAILKIVENKSMGEEMGKTAFNAVWSKFNLSLMIKLHQSLYARLIDQIVAVKS